MNQNQPISFGTTENEKAEKIKTIQKQLLQLMQHCCEKTFLSGFFSLSFWTKISEIDNNGTKQTAFVRKNLSFLNRVMSDTADDFFDFPDDKDNSKKKDQKRSSKLSQDQKNLDKKSEKRLSDLSEEDRKHSPKLCRTIMIDLYKSENQWTGRETIGQILNRCGDQFPHWMSGVPSYWLNASTLVCAIKKGIIQIDVNEQNNTVTIKHKHRNDFYQSDKTDRPVNENLALAKLSYLFKCYNAAAHGDDFEDLKKLISSPPEYIGRHDNVWNRMWGSIKKSILQLLNIDYSKYETKTYTATHLSRMNTDFFRNDQSKNPSFEQRIDVTTSVQVNGDPLKI